MSAGERTQACAPAATHEFVPVREACRGWLVTDRCRNAAEFILWGKLLPPEALGPRCYDCAARLVGHRALTDPARAIFHLERLYRAERASGSALPSAGKDGEQ